MSPVTLPKVRFIFKWPATIDDWHDGDTCTVHRIARPGLIIHGEKIRVEGINAPELSAAGGAASRDYAKKIAPPGMPVTLSSDTEDKYGRLLAYITLSDGSDFSELMVAANHAVPYNGG